MTPLRNPKSFLTVIVIAVIILFSRLTLPKYYFEGYTQELTYDVASYYLYLPVTIIYNDPGMKTNIIDSLWKKYNFSYTFYQTHNTKNNTRVPNYTSGMSYFYLPFFIFAHIWALNSDYLADGFSYPYQLLISIGVFAIILPGLFLLRRFLHFWFDDLVVTISLIVLFLGTNYFSEAISNYLQPHALLFTLYVILLYFAKRWHDSPSFFKAAIIGFVAGWITLTRPTDIICVLIPLLWGVYNKESINQKLTLILRNYKHIIVFIIAVFLPFVPQLIYWKITTGDFVYYSYKNTEGFDFLSPHIGKVFFSFKKSLFIYTPLLVLPLYGLFRLSKHTPKLKVFIVLFTLLNLYLLSSWAVWWCGSSFGMRYYVQSYAVLSIPLCISIHEILKTRRVKYLLFTIIAFLIFLNLFQSWQYAHWIIPPDRMNYKYYKTILFKRTVTNEEKRLMEEYRDPGYSESFDNENEYDSRPIAFYNFESYNSTPIDSSVIEKKYYFSYPNSCKLNTSIQFYPTYKISYSDLVKDNFDHVWLRVTLKYLSELDISENPTSLVINFPHGDYNLKYRAYDLEKYPFQKGKWNDLKIDYMTPYPYSEKDTFQIYMWYRGKNEIYIDNLKVEVFEKKIQKLN